jgi:hypothetical protein
LPVCYAKSCRCAFIMRDSNSSRWMTVTRYELLWRGLLFCNRARYERSSSLSSLHHIQRLAVRIKGWRWSSFFSTHPPHPESDRAASRAAHPPIAAFTSPHQHGHRSPGRQETPPGFRHAHSRPLSLSLPICPTYLLLIS